jgi:hypothetical protein
LRQSTTEIKDSPEVFWTRQFWKLDSNPKNANFSSWKELIDDFTNEAGLEMSYFFPGNSYLF